MLHFPLFIRYSLWALDSMLIYGTALLSVCLLVGLSLGRCIGMLLGVDADLGGVGIAMILLIAGSERLKRSGRMSPPTDAGIVFWGGIYVPIVVAMAASQNVLAAITGGFMAISAGLLTVIVAFLLLGVLNRTGKANNGMETNRATEDAS